MIDPFLQQLIPRLTVHLSKVFLPILNGTGQSHSDFNKPTLFFSEGDGHRLVLRLGHCRAFGHRGVNVFTGR